MADEFNPRRDLFRRYGDAFRAAWKDRAALGAARRYTSEEADFLPSSLAVSERPTPIMPHVALWALCGLFLFLVLWSLIGRMDVVIVASGKVLASGKTKMIQSVEPQVVRRIHVVEGETVLEGDLLVEFDSTSAEADLTRFQADMERARATRWAMETLLDNIGDKPVAQPIRIDRKPPAEVAQLALDTARNRWDEYRAKIERAAADLARRRAERNAIAVNAAALRLRLTKQTRVQTDYQAMASEKAIARHALVEQEMKTLELRLEIENSEAQRRQADLAIEEAEAALALVYATDKAAWRERLIDAERELSVAGTERSKAAFRLTLNRLHAPASGRVQQLAVSAAGAVVTSGQMIMALVPGGDPEEIEAMVENRDIGFIRVGQESEVKLEAFDYTRFGTVPAEVVVISADAVADDKGVLRYPVRLRLRRTSLDIGGRQVPIAAGMTAYADIKAGKRTIFSYFLSPIVKTVQESLRER